MTMIVVSPLGSHCELCGSFTRTNYYVPDIQSVFVCPQCRRADGPALLQVARAVQTGKLRPPGDVEA